MIDDSRDFWEKSRGRCDLTPSQELDLEGIVGAVCIELRKATKWYGPFNSSHEGYSIILEELDEAWDEIKANNLKLAKKEMIQVAAMCIRYIMDVRTE